MHGHLAPVLLGLRGAVHPAAHLAAGAVTESSTRADPRVTDGRVLRLDAGCASALLFSLRGVSLAVEEGGERWEQRRFSPGGTRHEVQFIVGLNASV